MGYSLEALICATSLKFEPNQLDVGRLCSMRALMLNYKCSLPGLKSLQIFINTNCSSLAHFRMFSTALGMSWGVALLTPHHYTGAFRCCSCTASALVLVVD
jgi:hypothetical protein